VAENKSSLENVLKSVLSVGNAEQNFAYPPHIYERHYNIVTSFLLDFLSKVYPKHVDILLPFLKSKKIAVTHGYVQLEEEYRNLIGAPSINVRPEGSDCNDPITIDTASEFKVANLKGGCSSAPIDIISKAEWDDRTTSEYAFPTHSDPIGLFIGSRRLKVCPYDIGKVEVTYVVKENIYRYGYIMQPDDTFIYDATTSVETQWTDAAFQPLFKGVLALYSAYSRDPQVSNYSQILNEAGLF
jgi:hypothetical protein